MALEAALAGLLALGMKGEEVGWRSRVGGRVDLVT